MTINKDIEKKAEFRHKSIFYRMFDVSETRLTEGQFFFRRNIRAVYYSALIILIIDAIWLGLNGVQGDSMGLFNSVTLTGMGLQMVACFFMLGVPHLYLKVNKEKLLRISSFLFYLITIFAVFALSYGKNIMLSEHNIDSQYAGISVSALYILVLCLAPLYYKPESIILGLCAAVLGILPRFLPGGESYNIASNIVLILIEIVLYVYFSSTIHKNYALNNVLLIENEDESAKQKAIINALSNDFASIMYVELDNNKCYRYRYDKNLEMDVFREQNSYDENSKTLIKQLVAEDDQERVIEALSRDSLVNHLKTDKVFYIKYKALDLDGHVVYYETKVAKVDEEDGNYAVIGVRNIDAQVRESQLYQKQLEDAMVAAEAANKAKSSFLFNMSHDIRTPMNAITGYIDMARKYKTNGEKLDDCLGKMKVASEHLLRLINDVLDMARIESGKVSLEEKPVDIRKAAADLKNIIFNSATQANIRLTSSININNKYVYMDILRCSQIILNLTSNAIKYTKEFGTVDISLKELEPTKRNFARMQVVVKDTGIGMSKDYLEHVYESFTREENTTKSGIQGTGLGMAITKNLLDMMGGKIDIQSEVGVGTTVTCIFEFRLADMLEEERKARPIEEYDLKGLKVLLVEDNELNREIARDILESLGVIVDEADDGSVAVDKVKDAEPNAYDIILMDVQMPFMDGYRATSIIRDLHDERKSRIPIIAMTANAFEEDKRRSLDVGMNAHLAKPINQQELVYTLSTFYKK